MNCILVDPVPINHSASTYEMTPAAKDEESLLVSVILLVVAAFFTYMSNENPFELLKFCSSHIGASLFKWNVSTEGQFIETFIGTLLLALVAIVVSPFFKRFAPKYAHYINPTSSILPGFVAYSIFFRYAILCAHKEGIV